MPDPKDQVNTKYSIFLNRLPPIGLLLYIDTLIYAQLWCVGSRKLDFPQFRELFKARKFPETKKTQFWELLARFRSQNHYYLKFREPFRPVWVTETSF